MSELAITFTSAEDLGMRLYELTPDLFYDQDYEPASQEDAKYGAATDALVTLGLSLVDPGDFHATAQGAAWYDGERRNCDIIELAKSEYATTAADRELRLGTPRGSEAAYVLAYVTAMNAGIDGDVGVLFNLTDVEGDN